MIQSEKRDRKMNENNEQSLKRPVGHQKPLPKTHRKPPQHTPLTVFTDEERQKGQKEYLKT